MKIAVFAYSRQGCRTARRILSALEGEQTCAFLPAKFSEEGFAPIEQPSAGFYGRLFETCDAMIFVGACGIAVRSIAPHIRSKTTDPAVLSVDELGEFVISLLSGHIGGANRLSRLLAEQLGATAVVTTATDINRRFSVDDWAASAGMAISDMKAAKEISAAILEHEVPLCSELPVVSALPSGVVSGNEGELGIYIGWQKKSPFRTTLRLIPRTLHIGIGCRRGTPVEAIRKAVDAVLEKEGIDAAAICCAASIDLKKDEEGLLVICRERGWPVTFYSAQELSAVPGDFTPSRFVQSITGVDNVCERSALLGCERLIVKKTALEGVTVALAAEMREISFG